MATISTSSLSLAGAAESVIAGLVSRRAANGRVIMSMPVAACTGSLVNVSVSEDPNGLFTVSDDGFAFREASDNCCSMKSFTAIAKKVANKYGAVFDGYSSLILRVDIGRLKGAIIAMTTLSKEIADLTMEADAKEKASTQRDFFDGKVASVFSGLAITREVELFGYSTQRYYFDYLVEVGGKKIALDFFSAKGNSINSAFATFSDVRRSEDAPKIIGMTPSIDEVGPKLILLRSVTNRIVDTQSSNENYNLLAA
jgi:hypothetical protein